MRPRVARILARVKETRAAAGRSQDLARFGPYLAGMIAAKSTSVLGQLLVSRLLGPIEFGRVAIVWTTATLIALPLTSAWGSGLVRYAAGKPDSMWPALLGWTTRATITSTALVASAVLLLSPFLAPLLDVPVSLPIAGAGMALCMAAWMLAKAACQAREDWPRFVAVELVWGIVLLTGPALLAWRAMFDWRWGVGMFSLAYAVGALAAARYMRTALRGSSLSVSAPLGPFGRYALLSGVTTAIFVFGDRFVVQRTFGLNEVGIYQVYSSATIGLASVLGMVVNNFVFPLFSRGDRASFTQLFRRFAVRAIPIAFVVLFVCGAAQVLLASFPLHPVLLAIASLSASLSLLASPLGVLLLSQGVSGSRRAAAVNVLSLTVFVVGVFPAIRFGGLIGVFAIQAVLYSLTFVLYRSALLSLPDPRAPTRV